jgi:hypothetical protein
MKTSPLSAREVEALTYVYSPEAASSVRSGWWGRALRRRSTVVGITLVIAVLAALAWAFVPV